MKTFGKIVVLGLLLSAACFTECRRITNPFEDTVIARVGKKTLHKSDLQGITPEGISGKDSIQLIETYVDSWVHKMVKEQQARKILRSSEDDIDELVDEYRNTLLARKLEQYCIDNFGGDSVYGESDYRKYYNTHREEFVLDRDMVRGRIVALPTSFRQKSKIKELVASTDSDRIADLSAMCQKSGLTLTDFAVWSDYADFLKALPTKRNESYQDLLSEHGTQEMTDKNVTYYFAITESKQSGEQSPYETVRDVVKWIVEKQHREAIVKWYDDSVYKAALEAKQVKINL